MAELHVSIAPEPVLQVGNWIISNSTFTTFFVTAIVVYGAYYIGQKAKTKPDSHLYQVIEVIYNFWEELGRSVVGTQSRKFMPIILSLFFFIIVSNWIGLLPGVGSIVIDEPHREETTQDLAASLTTYAADQEIVESASQEEPIEHQGTRAIPGETETAEEVAHAAAVPLFRAPTADLNTTFALAFISIAFVQFTGFKTLGTTSHLGKYINFSNPINFFVGFLEIIGELSRIISFAFRLFGNIFAGEVLLAVIAFLTTGLATIPLLPFLGLEIFVGFIQAFVFAILTLIFLSQAIESHDHH